MQHTLGFVDRQCAERIEARVLCIPTPLRLAGNLRHKVAGFTRHSQVGKYRLLAICNQVQSSLLSFRHAKWYILSHFESLVGRVVNLDVKVYRRTGSVMDNRLDGISAAISQAEVTLDFVGKRLKQLIDVRLVGSAWFVWGGRSSILATVCCLDVGDHCGEH